MGYEEDVPEPLERILRRERLHGEAVEVCPCYPPLSKRPDHRYLLGNNSTTHVDEVACLLHSLKLGRARGKTLKKRIDSYEKLIERANKVGHPMNLIHVVNDKVDYLERELKTINSKLDKILEKHSE